MKWLAEKLIVTGLFFYYWHDEGLRSALQEWRLYRKGVTARSVQRKSTTSGAS